VLWLLHSFVTVNVRLGDTAPSFVAVVLAAVFAIVLNVQSQPYRMLGLMVPATLVMLIAAGVGGLVSGGVFAPGWARQLYAVGLACGTAAIPLRYVGQQLRRYTAPLIVAGVLLAAKHLASARLSIVDADGSPAAWLTWEAVGGSAALVVLALRSQVRGAVELMLEFVLLPLFYRVRSAGPGAKQLPHTGACIVIANHGSWPDPIFLCKVLSRPVTPIMTQRFFEVWYLKPLVKDIFRAIVVSEAAVKRELPEIDLAIAALDRGECVLIFPEGYLRRRDEQPLRLFGQGLWHILKARPQTPIVPCWLSGVWGSKFSYGGGPPGGAGKPMDWFRKITIHLGAASLLPAGTVDEAMRTRLTLMNLVVDVQRTSTEPPLPHWDTSTRHPE